MPDAEYVNPTAKNLWQHCLSIPRELHWEKGRLYVQPVSELRKLRKEECKFVCKDEVKLEMPRLGELCYLNQGGNLNIYIGGGVDIRWQDGLVHLSMSRQAGCGRTERVLELPELKKLQMFMDASSLELFFNDGEKVMTSRYYPEDLPVVEIRGQGEGVWYELNSMTITWE